MTTSARSLPALLSQILIAFTVEFDNEFERRMRLAGHSARLSLVVWSNLMRFVDDNGVPVADLTARSRTPLNQIKFQLGCLERWRIVVLQPGRRDGWGSARGIHTDWIVQLTPSGRAAMKIWPPLFGEIERRWKNRFGEDLISGLRQALRSIAAGLECELPLSLPEMSLPELLSQVLQAFSLEFDRESPVPLLYCANTLRVLGEDPIRLSDIPRLTGTSSETSDIGWQIKPYVVVTPDPAARRGKVVSLSPRGLAVQRDYLRLTREIEKRWDHRFGGETIAALRASLLALFDGPLSQGMVPDEGAVRAGHDTPALGRRDIGPAARQRMRDMVAQTEAFIRDPAGSLPHYPAWDMNRGFGP